MKMGYWKKVQAELDEMGDSTDGMDIEKAMKSVERVFEDIWCKGECKTDEFGSFYNDGNKEVYTDRNGNKYECDKHHYTCAECNLITQIG